MKKEMKPIKKAMNNKVSRRIEKGLEYKEYQPSWWIRYRRKSLLEKLRKQLKECGVQRVWAHNHFLKAEEKKARNITLYIETRISEHEIHKLESELDRIFKRRRINLININTLQPAIRDYVFKDLSSLDKSPR